MARKAPNDNMGKGSSIKVIPAPVQETPAWQGSILVGGQPT